MPGKQAFGHYGGLHAQLPKTIAGGQWSLEHPVRPCGERKPDFTYVEHVSEGGQGIIMPNCGSPTMLSRETLRSRVPFRLSSQRSHSLTLPKRQVSPPLVVPLIGAPTSAQENQTSEHTCVCVLARVRVPGRVCV